MTPSRNMSDHEKIFFGRWFNCHLLLDPQKQHDTVYCADTIMQNEARYKAVGGPLGIPYWVVGLIHYRETSFNFSKHLHNGDDLSARTVHVPSGRPVEGEPPFSWETSATDALALKGWKNRGGWDVVATLVRCEIYNGWGYFQRGIPSPYIWSFTDQYTQGKFASDGKFDPKLIDQQPGVAAIMQALKIRGLDLNEVFPA